MTDETNTLRIKLRNGVREFEAEGPASAVRDLTRFVAPWLTDSKLGIVPEPIESEGDLAPSPAHSEEGLADAAQETAEAAPEPEKEGEIAPKSSPNHPETASNDPPVGGQMDANWQPEEARKPKARRDGLQADRVISYLRGLGDQPLPKTLAAIMTAAGVAPTNRTYLVRTGLPARGCKLEKIKGVGYRATLDDGTVIETPGPAARTRIDYVKQPFRRFTHAPDLDPENLRGLPDDHRAVVNGETLFPTTVVDADDSARILVAGGNSPKIGSHVTKGPWKGMPIFTVTLEERATCPDACHHWATCYGNGMPMARRHRHGARFEAILETEIAQKQRLHPDGFVVRLHVLGDFYGVGYVEKWRAWLDRFPALRVFGYTAYGADTAIGGAVAALAGDLWDRFAIRFSSPESLAQGATTLWRKPEGRVVAEGIVCPAMTDENRCCGNCGLCWAPAARQKTVVFVAHGRSFKERPRSQSKPKDGADEIYTDAFLAVMTWLRKEGVAIKNETPGLFKVNGFGGLTAQAVIKLANDRRARKKPTLPPFVVTEILKLRHGAAS